MPFKYFNNFTIIIQAKLYDFAGFEVWTKYVALSSWSLLFPWWVDKYVATSVTQTLYRFIIQNLFTLFVMFKPKRDVFNLFYCGAFGRYLRTIDYATQYTLHTENRISTIYVYIHIRWNNNTCINYVLHYLYFCMIHKESLTRRF